MWPFTAAVEVDEAELACTSHREREEVLVPALAPFMLEAAARTRLSARLKGRGGRQ